MGRMGKYRTLFHAIRLGDGWSGICLPLSGIYDLCQWRQAGVVQSTGVSEGIPPEQVPVDVLTITFAYREDDSPQPAYCLVLDCGLGLCLPTMISYSI